jgi:hypothetical protein
MTRIIGTRQFVDGMERAAYEEGDGPQSAF